jgi:hypothetical protein
VPLFSAKEIEEMLFEQFEQDTLNRKAAARRLNERQRLEEVEHGNED